MLITQPEGTPVKVTGDRTLNLIAFKGEYGKVLELQHGSKYSTLYAHLSNFSSTLPAGKIIKQGQVIGYVGKTGLTSGNHLHYEFKVNGKHHDPTTVKLPKSLPTPKNHYEVFIQQTKQILPYFMNTQRNI